MNPGEYRNRGVQSFHGVTEYLGQFGIFDTGGRQIHVRHLIHPDGEVEVVVNGTFLDELPPDVGPLDGRIGALG